VFLSVVPGSFFEVTISPVREPPLKLRRSGLLPSVGPLTLLSQAISKPEKEFHIDVSAPGFFSLLPHTHSYLNCRTRTDPQ